MKKQWISCCAALLACCMITGCSGGTQSTGQNDPSGTGSAADTQDEENYISTLTPAIDFYGYVNAEDLMNAELKPDMSTYGTITAIAEMTRDQVRELIEEIANSSEKFAPGSNEQLVHDLYWQIYDFVKYGEKDPGGENTELVEKYLDKIEAVSNTDELLSVWHDLSADLYVKAGFSAQVFPNIYDYREKVLYFCLPTLADLDEIKNNNVKATQARDNLSTYLKLLGLSEDEAKQRATDIIYMYYEIAGYSDPLFISGDKNYYEAFNIITREECSGKLKNMTYDQLVRSIGYNGEIPDKIVFMDEGQLEGVDSLLDSAHLRAWKDIAVITLLMNGSLLLPDKYSLIGFEGVTPEDTAFDYVKKTLEEQISEIYAEKYFNKKKAEIITKMCNDMVEEYYDLINGAEWLSEEGRAFLTRKLDNMQFFIGADEPHEIDPEDGELIGSTLLKTMFNFDSNKQQKDFDTLFSDAPYDGFKEMSAITTNACYVPPHNSIVIPAASMNKGLFDEDEDYATNLGGIGALIGHEISHAFDSKGVKFDAHGNFVPDAMPQEDIKAFKDLQDKAIAYYSSFKILGSHVDGKLTLGENLADISGLQCVISIAGDPESQKKAFEAFARMWEQLLTDTKAKEYLTEDVHSPHSVRVNAAVALFDEFYEIYGVKEGDPMYVAPENRIRRW